MNARIFQLLCFCLQIITSRWDKRECHIGLRIKPLPSFHSARGCRSPSAAETSASAAATSSAETIADAFSGDGWTHLDADTFSFTYSRSQKKLIGRVAAAPVTSGTSSETTSSRKDLVCSAFQLVITVGAYNVGLHGLRLLCGDVAAAERSCLSAGLPVQPSSSSMEHSNSLLQSGDKDDDSDANDEKGLAHRSAWSFDGLNSRGGAFASERTLNASGGAFGALCGPVIKVLVLKY